MDKAPSSFLVVFLFFLGCPPHRCLPYTEGPSSIGRTTVSATTSLQGRGKFHIIRDFDTTPGYIISTLGTSTASSRPTVSDSTKKTDTPEPTKNDHGLMVHTINIKSGSWNSALIRHRPGLVQVFFVTGIAFSIALLCGFMVSYMIYRLVKAEESQQLAKLYENVEIPLLGDDKELSEDEGQDESSHLLPENQKELGKFIGSVIRTKRRESIIKKKLMGQQRFSDEKITQMENF